MIPGMALRTLDRVLKPLQRHYLRSDVEEIVVCDAEVCFHKLRSPDRKGRWWREAPDPALHKEYLLDAIHFVANTYGLDFDPEGNATCYASLDDGARFTAAAGRSVFYDRPDPEGGVAMAVRQGRPKDAPKANFGWWALDADQRAGAQPAALHGLRRPMDNAHRAIYEAAAAGEPLLFSGPTSSGKTTLMQMLLDEMDPRLRVLCIEDTRELEIHNPNRTRMLVNKNPRPQGAAPDGSLEPRQIVDMVLRATPEAIICGEIASGNAALAQQLLGTGHGYFWTTVHAEDPRGACKAFVRQIAHTLPNVDRPRAERELAAQFTIVQCQKSRWNRTISHVMPRGTTDVADDAAEPAH